MEMAGAVKFYQDPQNEPIFSMEYCFKDFSIKAFMAPADN
jgi:hypothetical protein